MDKVTQSQANKIRPCKYIFVNTSCGKIWLVWYCDVNYYEYKRLGLADTKWTLYYGSRHNESEAEENKGITYTQTKMWCWESCIVSFQCLRLSSTSGAAMLRLLLFVSIISIELNTEQIFSGNFPEHIEKCVHVVLANNNF